MLESGGQLSLTLQRQIKGYINSDPGQRHQKCLPLGVFQRMIHNSATPLAEAIGQLTLGALFFGMRSCEYSQITGHRKTQLLRIKDIKFFRGKRELPKSRHMNTRKATTVSICFTRQKNDEKEAIISMHSTGKSLCPVRVWGSIVKRVLNYPNANENSFVNLVEQRTNGKSIFVQVKSTQTLSHIRNTVSQIGKDVLGFTAKEVGTHSIRSSFAMMLYLQGVRSEKIMLQGRWRSSAFLTYIRAQVSEFSTGLSDKLVSNREFYTIPDYNYDVCETHVLHEDLQHVPSIEFTEEELRSLPRIHVPAPTPSILAF